jgi:DNA-directed RNA polymerase subunit M/transcription elongation factor TFIIS
MMPVTFPLGEHLVSEADGMLVCKKCGRSTQITEADKFAETECETKTSQETVLTPKTVQTQPQQKNERQQCATCRLGEGKNEAPMLDPMTNQINKKLLCDNCFKDYLKILRFSGPRLGRVKARAPPDGVWFSYGENNNILFTQISGVWPCPACDEFYENLYEVVTHFATKHTEIADKQNEKMTVDVDGKPVEVLRTAQGCLICQCGFVADNKKHLTSHYVNSHREVF